MDTRTAVFKGQRIRRVLQNDKWYFSVNDVAKVLSVGSIPRRYWMDLKKKLTAEVF